METHSCGSDTSWLDLWSICVCLRFLILFSFFSPSNPPPCFTVKKPGPSGFKRGPVVCVCILKLSSVWEGGVKGCCATEVHRFHLPVCQMSCLAEFRTAMAVTKWQGGGCTRQWMPIWLQSTVSTEAPTCHETKRTEPVYGKLTYLHKTCKVTTHSDTGNIWITIQQSWHWPLWRDGNGLVRLARILCVLRAFPWLLIVLTWWRGLENHSDMPLIL